MLADPALANDARRPGWEKIFAWVKEQKNPPPVVALDKQKWVWRVNVKPILLNWRDAL